MTKLFLSYARDDDEPFVRRLYEDLTAAGLDVWFDRVSMPSRQLSFYQEIRDAIAERDRLLLVVGPHAVESHYVEQEWRFALEAGKCVNPIIRLDGPEGEVDGYSLIPEELALVHAEDFRDDAEYTEHRGNLVRQLSEPAPPLGKLVAVPTLPRHFRSQRERLVELRELLLVDLQKPVVVTGPAARVGVQGMGGIGKSVLANALARDQEVLSVLRTRSSPWTPTLHDTARPANLDSVVSGHRITQACRRRDGPALVRDRAVPRASGLLPQPS